jgi:hypothetical protein
MKIWCRLKTEDGYHYVYVDKDFAMMLCIKQGYEIKIDPSEVPEHIKKEWMNK